MFKAEPHRQTDGVQLSGDEESEATGRRDEAEITDTTEPSNRHAASLGRENNLRLDDEKD